MTLAESATLAPELAGLSAIAGDHDAVLCDVWGVLHNGVRSFEPAWRALLAFKQDGKRVVLVTNAPRPAAPVAAMLRRLGVPDEAYDAIVTSGDVTRSAIKAYDEPRLLHIGPERDFGFYDGTGATFTDDPAEASLVSITGLEDDTVEQPEDYRERFETYLEHDLAMVCANPDIVVERGDTLIWCAGALARLYEEMGGRTVLAGKPHPPIYEAATTEIGGLPKARVLAIGDGMETDIRGANRFGLPTLFISGGIHASEYGEAGPSGALETAGLTAVGTMPALVW